MEYQIEEKWIGKGTRIAESISDLTVLTAGQTMMIFFCMIASFGFTLLLLCFELMSKNLGEKIQRVKGGRGIRRRRASA